MSGSTKAHDLDAFLGHKPRAGGAKQLSNWKNRETKPLPRVDTVLHTQAKIISVWQHNWPRVVERTKDGVKTREVWSGKFNSWEEEEVLKKAYRVDEDGLPELPAELCPMSKLIERVRFLVIDGQLPWYTPLWKFKASDSDKNLTIHAAGIYNGIKDHRERLAAMIESGGEAAKLAAKEQQLAKNAGAPSLKEAWKQNMMAKCNYIFQVVDHDAPKDGIQVATETTAMGAAVQDVIRDAMTAHGDHPEKGNPLLHPYIIRWTYDEDANMSEKYGAIKMETPVSEEVMELVTNGKLPKIDHLIRRGNIAELRSSMEEHYIGPEKLLDFDAIFAAAEEFESEQQAEGQESEGEAVEEETAEAAPAKGNGSSRSEKAPTAKEGRSPKAGKYDVADVQQGENGEDRYFAADGVELFGCDECGEATRADESKCSHCGAKLQALSEPEPDPQPEPEPEKQMKLPGRAAKAPAESKQQKAAAKPNRVKF